MNTKTYATESVESFLARGGIITRCPSKRAPKRRQSKCYARTQVIDLMR